VNFLPVKLILLITSVTLFLSACQKQVIQNPPSNLGWDYQPLEKGHYIIYDVDSIIFDDFKKSVDTVRLEIKDEIGDEFIDDQGQSAFYVNRYVRKTSTEPWKMNLVYYISKDPYKLLWTENNLRYIKMVYPVKLNKKWFGNAYLASQTNDELRWLDGWEYRYTDVLVPFNTGIKEYDEIHIIDQANVIEGSPDNPDAYSARTYSREVFAPNVGMVYREVTRWEYQTTVQFRKGFTTIFKAKENN